MPARPAAAASAAICPRCGFDLCTAVSGWAESCPLDGRCTDCGLTFLWRDLLDPRSAPPRWSVEYCRWRLWLLACTATLVAALLAWPLWSRLNMSMRWRSGRLIAFIGSMLLLFVVVPWLGNAALAIQFWQRLQDPPRLSTLVGDPLLPPASFPPLVSRRPSLPVVLFEALVLPLASSSRARVVVSGRTLPFPPPRQFTMNGWSSRVIYVAEGPDGTRFAWEPLGSEPSIRWLIASIGPPGAGSSGSSPGVQTPTGPLILPPGTMPLATARGADHLLGMLTPRTNRPLVLVAFSMAALMPTIFAVLPATRRRCRVRWQHIARATAYSMAVPIMVALALMPMAYPLRALGVLDLQAATLATSRALTFLLPVGLGIWWAIAIHRYLRMPHALAIAAFAAVAAWIATAVLIPQVMLEPILVL